jgi:hypothetical protein
VPVVDAWLNDDIPPLDYEMAYLQDLVRRFVGGANAVGEPGEFITAAEAALAVARNSEMAREHLPPLAREALLGALLARIRERHRADLEVELRYQFHVIARSALERMTVGDDPGEEVAASLKAAREAERAGDGHTLENAMLDAAAWAIAWKVRLY